MPRVLLILAALVILTVSVSATFSELYPHPQDPKDRACEAQNGHCHPHGDSCSDFYEYRIGYCCNKGPCCKCTKRSSCSYNGGHCHTKLPCSHYYESEIKACGCGHNGSHGICCKCDTNKCERQGGHCHKQGYRCNPYTEEEVTGTCGCDPGKCCRPKKRTYSYRGR